MSAGQEHSYTRDLHANAGDETVTRDLVESALREDGFIPPLPEWKVTSVQPVARRQVATCVLIPGNYRHTVSVDEGGVATMHFFFTAEDIGPTATMDERRARALRMLLAVAEKALPVLRAMVAALPKAE